MLYYPRLHLVAAFSKNRVIGKDGTMPWTLSSDLQHFKRLTEGHTVLMGRKTFESIGKPLPNRKNIVLTKNHDFQADGVEVVHSLVDLLDRFSSEEIYVIGGGEIYRALINHCGSMILTQIDAVIEGDTLFPKFSQSCFKEEGRVRVEPGPKDDYPFEIIRYTRLPVYS